MKPLYLFLVSTILVFNSCNKRTKDSNDSLEITQLKSSYIALLDYKMTDLKKSISTYNTRFTNFEQIKNIVNLNELRVQWRSVHKNYLLVKTLLLGVNAPSEIQGLNNLSYYVTIPEYIDITSTNNTTGIIPNTTNYPLIHLGVLESAHLNGSSENVSLGLHALEFLLWGEDLSTTGPGARSNQDFSGGFGTIQERRFSYLKQTSYYMTNSVNDFNINSLSNSFNSKSNTEILQYLLSTSYRFVKNDCADRVLKKALDSQNQKDEESPFSDNSTEDLKSRILGLKEFLTGSYFESSNGYYLMDYFKDKDESTYTEIDASIKSIDEILQNFNETFDNAILSSVHRQKLISVYEQLNKIASAINSFAQSNGITDL